MTQHSGRSARAFLKADRRFGNHAKGGRRNTDSTTVAYAWNSYNLPSTVTDELRRVTTMAYDVLGHLTPRTDPDPDGAGRASAPVTTFTSNAVGNLTSLTDPVSNTTIWDTADKSRL